MTHQTFDRKTGAARLRLLATAGVLIASLSLGSCAMVDSVMGGKKDDSDKKVAPKNRRIQIMELDEKLTPDAHVADIPVTIPVAVRNASWSQPGGVAAHALHNVVLGTGDTSDPKKKLKKLWSMSAGSGSSDATPLTAPPIIVGGKVYVLDAEVTLRAFDLERRREVWERDLVPRGESARTGFGGGVAFGDGRIYAVTGFGEVRAIDAETGKDIWKKSVGVPIRSAPTFDEGRIFVIATDNQIHAYDAETGRSLWQHRALAETSGILSAVSPAVSDDIVVAPFTSGEIYALRVQNGNENWSDSLIRTGKTTAMAGINDIAARPVIDRGRVYAISHSGRMVSIDMRTGERVWAKNISGIQTPWIAGDFIYLVSVDAQLVCLARKDGGIKWITPLKRWKDQEDKKGSVAWTGPMMVNGRLMMMNSLGEMAFFNPIDGKVQTAFRGPGVAYIPPAVANGVVYVLTDEGDLVAMD